MTREQLGEIDRDIDGWVGEVVFRFLCSKMKTLGFPIHGGETGSNAEQKQVTKSLVVRYERLWSTIFRTLANCALVTAVQIQANA